MSDPSANPADYQFGIAWLKDSTDSGTPDYQAIELDTSLLVYDFALVSGGGQTVAPNAVSAEPIIVKLLHQNAPAANVAVTLSTGGSAATTGALGTSSTGPWQSELTLATDAQGEVQVWWQAPSQANQTVGLNATTPGQTTPLAIPAGTGGGGGGTAGFYPDANVLWDVKLRWALGDFEVEPRLSQAEIMSEQEQNVNEFLDSYGDELLNGSPIEVLANQNTIWARLWLPPSYWLGNDSLFPEIVGNELRGIPVGFSEVLWNYDSLGSAWWTAVQCYSNSNIEGPIYGNLLAIKQKVQSGIQQPLEVISNIRIMAPTANGLAQLDEMTNAPEIGFVNGRIILKPTIGAPRTDDYTGIFIIPNELHCKRACIQPRHYGKRTLVPPYRCNEPWANELGIEVIEGAITVYHNAVRDLQGRTKDFDVDFVSVPLNGDSWFQTKGPTTGQLLNADKHDAVFRNPKKGGLFEFQRNFSGDLGKVQLWLPVAGPDISAFWESEISYFKNFWGPAYRNRLDERTAFLEFLPIQRWALQRNLAFIDLASIGQDLDWTGMIKGAETPRGGRIDTGGPSGGNRLTLHGFVISYSKRNNMMYALIGREIGFLESQLIGAGSIINQISSGTFDSAETIESYRAGFDLFNGVSLENVMKARGLKMHQPNGWDQREWPSHEFSNETLTRKASAQLQSLIE